MESSPEIAVATFLAAMRELASGVAIVTVGQDRDITGFTATSVASLSGQPPRLLVCVNQASASWTSLQHYPHFAVNILCAADRGLANRFAGRDGLEGADRYTGGTWSPLVTGTPLLETALAALDCELEETLVRYDHGILIGKIRGVRLKPGALPLLYWKGDYHLFERGMTL